MKHSVASCSTDDPSRTKIARAKVSILEVDQGKRCSASAKAAILQDLKKLGKLDLDQGLTRRSLRRERTATAARTTDFGPCILQREFKTVNGPVVYPVLNPLAMLLLAMSTSLRYSQYVREAIARAGRPSAANPWSFVIYIDEVTCGNAMAARKSARRAVQGVYWALWQLGERALCADSCWFELVAFPTATKSNGR